MPHLDGRRPLRRRTVAPRIKIKRKGFMTTLALRGKFIKPTGKVTDIPDSRMPAFALSLVKAVGPATALRMFQVQITFRTRAKGAALVDRRKFEIGKQAIQKRFFPGRS